MTDHSRAWSSGPKALPEFAVLAFFWFLFWGNAKKGTKTISKDQKTNTLSFQKSNATNDFESQGATESCPLTSSQNPNATLYGRLLNTKNALDEDGAGGRTAVLEHSQAWSSGPKAQPEFAVLAFFWFLFWGNAKKGTKTRSNDKKPGFQYSKNQKYTFLIFLMP